jgi:class 3 adenylate cyclase/tetratricopeptide (TPR) repeat protein
MDVAIWLQSLGLERYVEAFAANDINADVLPELTAGDLIELGVTSIGHRRRLLAAIAARRAGLAPSTGRSADEAPVVAAKAGLPYPEAELRQVTVLFCDLVGYTELSRQLDAEQVHGLLERFFVRVDSIVESFGGRVDKHIGDCVMAVFGAPVAHGNDPERAARAALAIRDAMPTLSAQLGHAVAVHLGLASGQVVASGTGSDAHRTYTVTGNSVNIASRLTDQAGSGEILISDAVRRLLPEHFVCNDAGALKVKGLTEPLAAWRLSEVRDEAEPRDRLFVGRCAEIAQFDGVVQGCLDAGSGQTVYLRGEAGIGKTRLLEEFQRRAAARGFACHTGLVLDFGTATGHDPIRALVRSMFDIHPDSDPAQSQVALERAVTADPMLAERRVFLNDLLDLPQPTELRALYDAMDSAMRSRGMRETVAALVRHASMGVPVLLAVEDLHWADQPTLDYLASLANTVAACRAVLVMTSRIEGDPLDHTWRTSTGGSPLMTIELGPLRAREATALAEAYLEANSVFARRCIDRAAGNPLFLEQLLRHAEDVTETVVPGSVQSLVQARLDHLAAPDKRAAQAAAVFGQRFALDALRHLVQDPRYDCAALVERFLVRPVGEGFLFSHALIRDAVYDTLLKAKRRELHSRAAAWFEKRDLTLHAEHLDRAEDPAAPAAYLAAGRELARGYRYQQALPLVERALALSVVAAERFALTCLQGELFEHLGAMPAALSAYQTALDAAQDDIERCRARLGLAEIKRVTDQLDSAFADLDLAQAAATSEGLTEELARIYFLRGNLFFPKGNIEGCLAAHRKSLELARQAGSVELEAQALGGLGDAEYVRGRMLSAHGHFENCIELCRRHGFARIEVGHLMMRGAAELFRNGLSSALSDSFDAANMAAKIGNKRAEMSARGWLAYLALFEAGNEELATEQSECALRQAQQLGAKRFEQVSLMTLAWLQVRGGDRAGGMALAERAVAISRETGPTFGGPATLGKFARLTDDHKTREQALQEAEALLKSGCVSHNYFFFCRDAMEICLVEQDWARVEHYAKFLERYTQPEPQPWSEFCIARAQSLAAYGSGRRDEATIRQLQGVYDEAGRVGFKPWLPLVEAALAGQPIAGPASPPDIRM